MDYGLLKQSKKIGLDDNGGVVLWFRLLTGMLFDLPHINYWNSTLSAFMENGNLVSNFEFFNGLFVFAAKTKHKS